MTSNNQPCKDSSSVYVISSDSDADEVDDTLSSSPVFKQRKVKIYSGAYSGLLPS